MAATLPIREVERYLFDRDNFVARIYAILLLMSLAACTGKFSSLKGDLSTLASQSTSSASSLTDTPPNVTDPTVTPAMALPKAIAGQNYALTFDDEFTDRNTISNGPTFNGAKWYNATEQCCMGDSTGLPALMFPSVYNGKSVDPYSILTGGGLGITLSKVNDVWYSGVLTSVDGKGQGFSQKYGYFEISAKLSGDIGTWPAFWLLNTSSLTGQSASTGAGEIDVFEQYGIFKGFCTTYHDWSGGTTPYYNCNNSVNSVSDDFHKYALLWTETSMTVYFDDVAMNTTTTPDVMKQPYYMLVDMGLGGGWPTTATPSTSTMQVKYVRAYAAP